MTAKWNFGLHGYSFGKLKRQDIDTMVNDFFLKGRTFKAIGEDFNMSRDTISQIIKLVTGFRARHGGTSRAWAIECAAQCLKEYERRMIDFEGEKNRAQADQEWRKRAAERRRLNRANKMRAELHRRTGI